MKGFLRGEEGVMTDLLCGTTGGKDGELFDNGGSLAGNWSDATAGCAPGQLKT
jgi:hypothetical protein